MRGAGGQGEPPEVRAVRGARELLGVAQEAGAHEVTRAYWRQARRLHPDLSRDPGATEQFRALHTAYQLALHAVPQSPAPTDPSRGRRRTPWSDVRGRPSTGTATPAGNPADGVWIVAGPVHVHPGTRLGPTGSPQQEGS